jgi:hypothetical protein
VFRFENVSKRAEGSKGDPVMAGIGAVVAAVVNKRFVGYGRGLFAMP